MDDDDNDEITIYNANDADIELDGLLLYMGSGLNFACTSSWTESGTVDDKLSSGETATASCVLGPDDAIRLVDANPLNSGTAECGSTCGDYDYVIDGVCWNSDGLTIHGDCDETDDPMIKAGIWTIDDAEHCSSCDYIQLISNGDNDAGIVDWESIPEFSTLLMPIASVLMIVGYSRYRRKNVPEA